MPDNAIAGIAQRQGNLLCRARAEGNDTSTTTCSGQLCADRTVLAGDIHHPFQHWCGYAYGIEQAMTQVHQDAQRPVVLADECSRFEQPERMATLGRPPLRIDIMNHIDGVTFRDAWPGRVVAQFGDYQVGFLGLEHLRANKLAAGRAKDLADVALMAEMTEALRETTTSTKGSDRSRVAKKTRRGGH